MYIFYTYFLYLSSLLIMLWDKFYHNPQIIKTNSFFNQNIYFNKSYNIKEEFIKNEYLKTNKYQIYLDKSQDKICKEWFDIVDKTYNYTTIIYTMSTINKGTNKTSEQQAETFSLGQLDGCN